MKEKKTKSLPVTVNGDDLTLRKAQEAIAMTPRPGSTLTLLTRKLFNVMIALAQQQGVDKEVYKAPLADIVSEAKFNSNDTELVKVHLRKMLETVVEWNSSGPEGRRWGGTSLLGYVEIIEDPHTRKCDIEWGYIGKIKRRMLQPDVYAKLSLQFLTTLRSTSSIALYEICARYAGSPGAITMRQPWEWWRPVLTGVADSDDKEGGWKIYKYFKRDVLKSSMREINQITDIEVELIEHTIGRRVLDLQFRVSRKAQKGFEFQESNILNMRLYNEMIALGLKEREAEDAFGNYEEGVIKACVDATHERMKKQPALDSTAAYLKSALKKGWAKPLTEQVPALPKQEKKKKIDRKTAMSMLIGKRSTEAEALFGTREDAALLLDEFTTDKLPLLNDTVLKSFNKSGLESKLVRVQFFQWLGIKLWGEPSDRDLVDFLLDHES